MAYFLRACVGLVMKLLKRPTASIFAPSVYVPLNGIFIGESSFGAQLKCYPKKETSFIQCHLLFISCQIYSAHTFIPIRN